MEITFLGHASFRIREKVGEWVSLVTDPFDPKFVGLSFPRVTASIVTISHEHQDHNNLALVKGDEGVEPRVLRGPGEYEVRGVNILGINTYHDREQGRARGENTVFAITIGGIRTVHLGDLGHKLTDNQLGALGNVDIVLVPVGGYYTIGAEVATEVVTQLEPHIVIPMHYQMSGLNPQVFAKLADVGEFVKALGVTPKHLNSLLVRGETLPEEMELVILERRG